MFARIFKPAKTAMQSGQAKTEDWVLEIEPEMARSIDPLMGWTSGDWATSGQVRLKFPSSEDAIAYAEKHGIPFRVDQPKERTLRAKAYADNFSFRRRKPWTH